MSKCIDCEHARQAGNKKSTSVVGCAKMTWGENIKHPKDETKNIYEGYLYGGRRVGDVSESKELGKGVITLGVLIDADAEMDCFHYRD